MKSGNLSGIIKCKIGNWIGVAYKIPRDDIEHCKKFDELKNSGVYFLFGNSNDNEKPVAYIGQASNRKNGEGILSRLLEHKKSTDKDYWQEAVAFTTRDNSLGLTEISFLENKFCNLAITASRYEVKNNNDPTLGHISEEKEIELTEFAEYIKLAVEIFGYKIFTPVEEIPRIEKSTGEQTFQLSRQRKDLNFLIKATGKKTAEGFVVLAGSKISPEEDSILSANIKKARRNAKIDADNVLQENVAFTLPSPAASFVLGKPVNGWDYWKTADGVPLKNFR